MRRTIPIAVLIAAVLAFAVLFATGWASSHKSPPTATVKIVQLKNGNYAFKPADITIKPGTEVIWNNTSGTDHTVTVNNHAGIDDIPPSSKAHLTFAKAGTFKYHCSFHPYMKGKITIKK